MKRVRALSSSLQKGERGGASAGQPAANRDTTEGVPIAFSDAP